MGKTTMQDIADYLNISKNSVSQALRNKNGVSEKTKAMVKDAAKIVGYEYKEKTTPFHYQKVGLLATEFALSQTSFFGEIVTQLRKKCAENQLDLTIFPISSHMITHSILPANLTELDGVFVLSHITNAYIQKVTQLEIPCVLIDHHTPELIADAVLTQNIEGAYLATHYLIEKGYRKIGFIGDTKFSPSYKERLVGFQKALTAANLSADPTTIITDIEENQHSLFERLSKVATMPEAWFCVNSGLAFILNSYLQSKGLSIPKDIGIICFDNTEFTRMATPQITNISTDLHYMSTLSLELLIKRMLKKELPFTQVKIMPQLNICASLAK